MPDFYGVVSTPYQAQGALVNSGFANNPAGGTNLSILTIPEAGVYHVTALSLAVDTTAPGGEIEAGNFGMLLNFPVAPNILILLPSSRSGLEWSSYLQLEAGTIVSVGTFLPGSANSLYISTLSALPFT